MPLSKYLIRNEYSLADPELYRAADKDDPEALLEAVAMAGLVGLLRQLGDLAEFAAEIFHDLHEEVMATAARGHSLAARVKQLEAEVPSLEKAFFSQTHHSSFFTNGGIDWHSNLQSEQNLVTGGNLPRLIMDSYEECRGPPRLFLLDKFDVAGAGACLKRYTDPSFFRMESASSVRATVQVQRERRIRKVKKKGARLRDGEAPNAVPTHSKLHQLLLEERIENGYSNPARLVKLKKRQLNGPAVDAKSGKSYMEKFLETPSPDPKMIYETSIFPLPVKPASDDFSETGIKVLEISSIKKSFGDENSCSPPYEQEFQLNQFPEEVGEANGDLVMVKEQIAVGVRDGMSFNDVKVSDEAELAINEQKRIEGILERYNSDDVTSEVDNYMDALTTMESELETDDEYKPKKSFLNIKKATYINNKEHQLQARLSDSQSFGGSSTSDDISSFKQETNEEDIEVRARLSNSHSTGTSSTSDNNSSFRGDEDEHVELQAHFSDSQSTGKSSKSNVNSSSMKDKSYLPHYDSLSTVVENVQSEPILFSTTKYHEAEIEGLPSNQLPEIVEFQNTDNRKFVMCDDAHVHEEGVSDSRQTNSELLTSGKMLCSDLEPTKPVTLPAVIQSDESVSDNVELNRLGNGADRSGLVESFVSKPSYPSLIKDDTVPVYSSDKISSDNLVDDSLCNDSQEGSLCPSIKELGLNLGDEINGFSSSVDPVEGDGHIENPSSYNHVMVNGAITESKDQPIPSVDSAENDAGIITCPASSMISSPSRSLSNPRELVHASSDSYPMESNEVELTQISSDSNTESQLAPLPDTTNILYFPMSNLTKLEESVSAFADLNEKETEDHEVVARESLTALEGQKVAGHPELVSSDVQMNLNKLVPCDDLPDLGNNIEKSPPRKKILQSVFQDDAKVVPGFSGFDTRQSESTSYGQNDLIQNDTNSFSSTPDNKLEFETYFEPHLQCQLDEQDGDFPLNYEENFGSEKSQSQKMHINQMKQEGTHATSESVSETPADESPSFCSSPQSSGPEINPTQYVTDPLKPLLPDHFPKETENKLDGMPPMPPLPPMQWRMSKVPHASLDSNREELEVDPSPVQRMQPVMPDTKSQFGFTASDGNTLFHQNPFLPIMALESDKLQHSSAVSVSGHPVALPIQFPIVVNEANGQYGQYNYLVLDVNQIQNPVLTLPVVPASMHPPLGYIVASDGEIVHTSNPYAPILPVVYTASGHDSSSPQVEPFQRPTQVMTESSADDKTQEQPSSEMELKQQGPVVEQIQNVASQDTSNPTLLHKQSQDECLQRHTVPVSHQHSQTNEVQKSEKDPVFNHEVIKTNNPNCESQYAKLQQMSNQQATVNEQPSSQINRSKQVPFGLLLPILIPQLAKDRAMQLTTLFNKLKKDEIPKDHFVRLMKGIMGDQMLRIALTKVQQQTKANAGSSGQQHPVRMPTVTSSGTKFNDPHALAQLHQRSMNLAADHSHNTSSAIQVKSEPTYSTVDIGAKKSLEHDVRVLQPNQLPSSGSNAVSQETERSSVHIQGLNKQQQQHIHFPSTYGSSGGNYNHFSGTTTGSSSLRPQPHPHDSHIRQIPHQNIGLNHLGVERQSSFTDPKRMPGGSVSTGVNNTAPQQTSTSWQPSAEQNSGLFSSVSYVKKEPNDLSIEQQHRNHLSKLHGLPSVNSGQTEQGSGVNQGTVKDEFSRGSLALTSMPHTTSASLPTSSSASQLDPTVSLSSQIPASTSGMVSKTPVKRPLGQKKPLETLGSSPPPPSKKQKVSGSSMEQSIEQLNDVTAVSGVDLREEEEQLFSGSKEDSRVSEASRRVVQEEEESLILLKAPLQRKLIEIMTECGLKGMGNDVEKCLSLCVEERMRGVISNIVRMSKQRVDIEKTRHRTVVTSDVRQQIMAMNRKAREEWEKKQAEVDKLRKLNDVEGGSGVDGDKDRDDGRNKATKVNKEVDDKMRTNAANVAARAAVGGDDMLSKWQLMAEQARQKREGGTDTASGSQPTKDVSRKSSPSSGRSTKDNQERERKGPNSLGSSASGRKFGKNHSPGSQTRIARSISVKDVIAVLEREPQMSKSSLLYRLHERIHSDTSTE